MISVSKKKQEEILWKETFDFSEDRQIYINDLWNRRGEELIIRLDMMNLPVIDTDFPGELQFLRIRYRKNDKFHTKWPKEWKQHKKWNIISTHLWSFYPIGIYCKTQSVELKNQKYVFLARYSIIENSKEKHLYIGRIEVASDGSILEWSHENKCESLPLLLKFPKSMFAKINQCLANNFLPDLWIGYGYAKWHRTDEGISRYMLTYGSKKRPYIEPLLSLLRSGCGGAAAILLAFICFSVSKPFFPQYRSLDKTSSYLQAKKYIPRQISINIRSDSPGVAFQLANLCCGCFRPSEPRAASSGHRRRKKPVIDGVDVQYSQENVYLGIDSFEAAILQPASVLWVNRRPAPELVESGKIIDIALSSDIEEIEGEPFVWDLISDWTEKISSMTQEGYHAMRKADWKKSAPIMDELLTKLEKTILKYNVNFNGEKMRIEHDSLKDSSPENPEDILLHFRHLKSWIERDLDWFVRHRGKGEDDPILAAEVEIEKLFAQYWRVIKKNHKQSIKEHFSFGSRYEDVVGKMNANSKYSGLDPDTIDKMAYLYTSFWSFVATCIPEENQKKEVFSIFEKSLDELFVKDKRSPQEILEEYIKGLLTEKHFARIRGEGSDRPDVCVWYDARHNFFLLPKDTYFSDIQKLFPKGLTITQMKWEQQLVKEELVLYTNRVNQQRYGYEIKLKKGSNQTQAVLKIPGGKLSKKFFEDVAVKAAIEQMKTDPTKLRPQNKVLSADK